MSEIFVLSVHLCCLMSSDVGWHIWDKLETNAEARFNIASSETRRLVRTDSEGRPPRLSHSSWTMVRSFWCTMLFVLVLNPDTERALTEHRSPIFHQWLFQADSRCKLCSYLLHASLAVEEASRRIHAFQKRQLALITSTLPLACAACVYIRSNRYYRERSQFSADAKQRNPNDYHVHTA